MSGRMDLFCAWAELDPFVCSSLPTGENGDFSVGAAGPGGCRLVTDCEPCTASVDGGASFGAASVASPVPTPVAGVDGATSKSPPAGSTTPELSEPCSVAPSLLAESCTSDLPLTGFCSGKFVLSCNVCLEVLTRLLKNSGYDPVIRCT